MRTIFVDFCAFLFLQLIHIYQDCFSDTGQVCYCPSDSKILTNMVEIGKSTGTKTRQKNMKKKKRTAYIFFGMYYSNKCEYMHRPYQMSTSTSDTSFTNMIKSDPIITTSNLAA